MSWCVEALRGYSGGAAGARLELGGALAALRAQPRAPLAAGQKALQRLKVRGSGAGAAWSRAGTGRAGARQQLGGALAALDLT